ncbi:MAG: PEP-CTERM sorting domain-containing protein [Candidatus Eisenbacteria bacterium]|uniref:PEP-CTERM sorting domain-containing protein n=1 Tax=Eiseniibacteriota bacterium TaxID=2212470 RepID=A0A956NE26_UNCEI|nr:PEP-CTERM sorting domain-containing protein [Candidatus Eisenbacteria bacterium]MCB9465628.1 PEP-CTERM sorting domain-containing protein [Candidatus Eisenbacteria bacterium]
MHFGQPSVGTSGPRLERQNCRPSTIWIFAVALFLLALTPATSSSVPIYFDETGHYYDFVQQSQISWSAANSAALAMSYEGEMGCLATITSQEENDFIYCVFGHHFWEAWLGGFQDEDANPPDSWRWITDEEWDYTNWAPGEPNGPGGASQGGHVQMWGSNSIAPGYWNDDPVNTDIAAVSGYLVEYGAMPDPVPEPGTVGLLGFGMMLAAMVNRAKKHPRDRA